MSFGFGSAANTSSQAGTLFGAPSTTNTSAFGTNTSNTSAAGTLFGGSAANTGFGGFNKPATSTPFGATSQPTGFGAAAAPASTAFGGFGSTPAPATSAPSTGFGGFGAPATSAPATGGFGGFGNATTTPATSSAGFGGFGSNLNTTSVPASSGFGGFGATAPATSTPAASSGFGGFGTPASATGGGFGGFGAPATSTATTGGFGNTASGLFGNKLGGGFNNTTQQPQQQVVKETAWQDLALVRAHFDPTNALCQFRHYFYNMVPANEAHLYVRPQNQDEQLWNEAQRRNPDPKCMVPVLAVGFDDILKRMEIQSKQVELHAEKLKETQERLNNVQRQHILRTCVKLEEHKRRHTDLTQRLLRLLRFSQVLRYKGFPLNAEEEAAIHQLNNLATASNNPEQVYAKMLHLWNTLQQIKSQKQMDQSAKAEAWRTVRDEDTDNITKVLEDEQKGIMHVASILKADTKELELIENHMRKDSRMNK